MKAYRVIFVIALGLLCTVFFMKAFTQAVQGLSTVRYVSHDPTCGGMSPCYTDIQSAIDASNGEDEIRVAAGTYSDLHAMPRKDVVTTGVVTQVVYITRTISMIGGYTTTNWTQSNPLANPTILDANHKGRVLYIAGNISPTIRNFTLLHGSANKLGGWGHQPPDRDAGGGIYVITAEVTLKNNDVLSNTSNNYGGGIYLYHSTAQIDRNMILYNYAHGYGAGILVDASTVSITNNRISQNWNTNAYGGGICMMYNWNGISKVSSNTIISNESYQGGGIWLLLSNATFDGNLITNNIARIQDSCNAGEGGGVYMQSSNPTFINSVIASNQTCGIGSGVFILHSTPIFIHSTLSHNTGGEGGAFYLSNQYDLTSTLYLTNTILVSHTVGITVTSGSIAHVDGILWWDNNIDTGGAGSIIVNYSFNYGPAFKPDGYHLSQNSGAINLGLTTWVLTDIDGDQRLDIPDLGADEWWWKQEVILPLLLR